MVSVFLLAGCMDIPQESAAQTEPVDTVTESVAETETAVSVSYPADIFPAEELSAILANDLETALLETPPPWTAVTPNGIGLNDELILRTAFFAYEIFKEVVIKDEEGFLLPVETVQDAADLLFSEPPQIASYRFGSTYRNNADYADHIRMPLEYYEQKKFYYVQYRIQTETFRYDAETNTIGCAIDFMKPGADKSYTELDCRKEVSLSPFIIGGKIYYRFNELSDYGTYNTEPERQTYTITDCRDWEQLGLNKTDIRYLFLKAFIEGDIETLERMANAVEGVYDSYKSMELGEYSITRTDIHPISPLNQSRDGFIIFNFDLLSSENEILHAGRHSRLIEYGLCMEMTDYENYEVFPVLTEAQIVIRLFSMHGFTSFPDFKSKNYRGYSVVSPVYILSRLNKDDYKPRAAEEIIAYAKKYFDIDDYIIDEEFLVKTEDGYDILGMGAPSPSFNLVSEEIRDGITVVTVQFWADFSQTVKSVLVEFFLEPLDGDYKPLYSKILEDTGHPTSWVST